MLARLHKPDPNLPADKQDKRAVVDGEPEDWAAWLAGPVDGAQLLIRPRPADFSIRPTRSGPTLFSSNWARTKTRFSKSCWRRSDLT